MSNDLFESASRDFASDPELVRPDLGASALSSVVHAYAPLFPDGELTAFLPAAPAPGDEPAALARDVAALHLALGSGRFAPETTDTPDGEG
jgi:hypothetical protein